MWQICLFKALSLSVNKGAHYTTTPQKEHRQRQWKPKSEGCSRRQKIYWRFYSQIKPSVEQRCHVGLNGKSQKTQKNIFHIITLLKEGEEKGKRKAKWIYCRFSIQFRLCVALWFIGWKLFVFILSQRPRLVPCFCALENPIKINRFAFN